MIICCQKPPIVIPKVQKRRIIKTAIKHAKLICQDYEYAKECKEAWDDVNKLMDQLTQEISKEDLIQFLFDDGTLS